MSHVTHMKESCHTLEWVMSHMWMRHVTHVNKLCHTELIWDPSSTTQVNESCHTYERVMSHIWKSHVTRMKERARDEKEGEMQEKCTGAEAKVHADHTLLRQLLCPSCTWGECYMLYVIWWHAMSGSKLCTETHDIWNHICWVMYYKQQ